MKKGFLLSLLLFGSPLFGFQYKDNTAFVFSELLIWQMREAGDDNWAQILGPTGTHQQIQFLDVPFQWNPGFRTGVGYQDEASPWSVLFYYTWYKTKGINQANIVSGELHSSFLGNFFAENLTGAGLSGPYYHNAGMDWKVLFNSLDLELGRTILIDELLGLHPFVGIKAGMINQTINTYWQNPYNNATKTPIATYSLATENITNNFKGIGPSAGLETTWHIFDTRVHTFNLIGNFSGALLWGHWELSDIYRNNTPVSIAILNDSLSTAVPMARGYIGMEWTHVFNNANWDLRLGYEGQFWFNQLKYYSFDMGRSTGSLAFQGGVLDFCIHF